MSKKLLAIIIAALLFIVAMMFTPKIISSIKGGGNNKKEQEIPAHQTELQAVTLADVKSDVYYVNYRDSFYAVPTGTTTFGKETKVRETSPKRIVTFSDDDETIPTLFMDDNLILKASSIPNTFVWERFQDLGWSVGAYGFTQNDAGKYILSVDTNHINQYTTMYQELIKSPDLAAADVITIDRINGAQLSSANVTEAGTFADLERGESCDLDLYLGTAYYGLNVTADTHIFSGFESYETSSYDYLEDGYIRVILPSYFKSGYYYINGVGLLRYVNRPRSEGATGVLYNDPYYLGKDANGNYIVADDTQDDVPEEEKNGEVFDISVHIDTSVTSAFYAVRYSEPTIPPEIKYNILYGISPKAVITGPDGNTREFTLPDTDETNTLVCWLEMPISGIYEIKISGMDYRTFNIEQYIETGKADSLNHQGNGTGELKFHVNNFMKDAKFTVTWDKKDRAATMKLLHSDGKTNLLENAKIVDQDYGYVTYMLHDLDEGDFTLQVTGDSLGYVRYYLEEQYPEETIEEETEEGTEGEEETEASAAEEGMEEGETEKENEMVSESDLTTEESTKDEK